MKAKAANRPLLAPFGGQGICECLGRNRPVKCRVEDRHVGRVRKRLARLREALERGAVVQRHDRLELDDLPLDRFVDESWLDESRTAVDDTVGYRLGCGIDLREGSDG